MQLQREPNSDACNNVLYAEIFETDTNSGVLEQPRVFPACKKTLVNIFAPGADDISRGKGQRGCFGVPDADRHRSKFGWVEVRENQPLRDLAQIQVFQTQRKSCHATDVKRNNLGKIYTNFGQHILCLTYF